jgi:hypothetical protein
MPLSPLLPRGNSRSLIDFFRTDSAHPIEFVTPQTSQ